VSSVLSLSFKRFYFSERNDRLKKQQQAKELDDLKTELREMTDALDKARTIKIDEKSHLYEVSIWAKFIASI